MDTRLLLFLLTISLLLTACYEADDEFTINADGSGKLSFVRIIKVMGDPDEMLRMTVANIVKKWQGVEAWKDISFELQDDGRGRIKGTAYFPDIRKFSDSEDIDALKGVSFTRSGDQGLRIVLGEPAAEPAKSGDPGTAAETAVLSGDELKKAIREKRAEYQAQKPMMEAVLNDLRIERRFRLPGKITKLNALQKQSDSVARYSLDGAKLLQAMDQAMMDDKFMSVSIHAGTGQESEVSIPPGLKEKMFGEPGPAAIEVGGELKDLFDYKSEVRTAMSAEKMLASLEPVQLEVVVPAQVEVRADAQSTLPAPSATAGPDPAAPPTLRTGDVKVTASAQVPFGGGSINNLVYSFPVEVELTFTGGAAASAFRFGKITLGSAVDEIGQAMDPVRLDQDFTIIDRAKLDFSSNKPKHPADGFRTNVRFMRPDENAIPRSVTIAGTITVQTPRKISVDAIGTLLAGTGQVALKNPALDALGSFTLGRQGGRVNVTVEGKSDAVTGVAVSLRDAEGKPLRSDGSMSTGPNDRYRVQHDFLAGASDLATTLLEVLLPQETMVVPFDIKDLQVPVPSEMPGNVGEPLPAPPDLQLAGVEMHARDAGAGGSPDTTAYLYLDGTMTLTRQVESVARLRVISARVSDGVNLRIKRRSNEDPGHIWSLDESGQKVSFSVPVKKPAAAGGVIRDVAGDVVVTVGEGAEPVDLGFTDLVAGAAGKKLGARIEGLSRDHEAGGAERIEIHLQTPPNTIRMSRPALRDEEPAVRILDEMGAEVQPARRLLGSFGEGNKGSVLSVWIPQGVPRKGTVLVEQIRGVKQYRVPFTVAGIDLSAGAAPIAAAAPSRPARPRTEAARTPAASAPTTAPSQSDAGVPSQTGNVAIAASAHLAGRQGPWDGWETLMPIEVRLVFTGGAAASADRYGKIQVAAHPDETGGRPLEMKKFSIGSKLPSGFERIDRTEVDFFSKERLHPDNGFSLTMDFQRPRQEARIASLAGTVKLLSMGRTIFDDIGSRLSGPAKVALRDPRLDALGSFSISREDDTLYVHMDVLQEKFESGTVELLDADGKSFSMAGASGGFQRGGRNQITHKYSVGGRSLAGARLEVNAPRSAVVVPFEIKDLPVDIPPAMRDALAKEKAQPATRPQTAAVNPARPAPPSMAKRPPAPLPPFSPSPAWKQAVLVNEAPFDAGALLRWDSRQGNEAGRALVRSPDGKILVAGTLRGANRAAASSITEVVIVRFAADGSLDANFGNGGIARWNDSVGDVRDIASALAPDGKILVAGSLRIAENGREKSEIVLLRFNADGSPDAGFGTGGVVRWASDQGTNTFGNLVIQPDGKVIVAGGVYSMTGGRVKYELVLLRFDAAGSLDPTFRNGVFAREKALIPENVKAMAIQRDGRILLAGHSRNPSNPNQTDAILARLDPDGSLDAGFGQGGSAAWDNNGRNETVSALELQADGRILVAGSSGRNQDFRVFVLKFNADGSREPGFGGGGAMIWESGHGTDSCAGFGVRSDGKIVVAGVGHDRSGKNEAPFLARFNVDGSLDAAFGTRGVLAWSAAGNTGENQYLYDMILQPDDTVLLTGSIGSGMNVTDLFLMKFR